MPDLYAFVSMTFIDEEGRYFTCNGFTIRKSKFNKKPFLAMPSKKSKNGYFIFNLIEENLKRQIEQEAIREYKYMIYED
ncbi:MAG: hypothetical protein EXS52_01265 [Candidatus Staskawiczbacteria bacterium]|nr:hypothetical protein [Candidatus Staskawiczbacteria bacterium]